MYKCVNVIMARAAEAYISTGWRTSLCRHVVSSTDQSEITNTKPVFIATIQIDFDTSEITVKTDFVQTDPHSVHSA